MVSVVKFGGTSLKDKESLVRVAGIVGRLVETEKKLIAVVSAQGDFTDTLLSKATEVSDNICPREMDALLASGEQISAALFSTALNSMGIPAKSLTAWQAEILTSSKFGSAEILAVGKEKLLAELEKFKVLVVTGFQGVSPDGDITTLGRGGSDTSAVAIAAALKSPVCRIYTDVDGVFSADPRRVKTARILHHLSYDTMLLMAKSGAGVLHDRCVTMARDENVPLQVLSSINPGKGTLIDSEFCEPEGVSSIASLGSDRDTVFVSTVGRGLVGLDVADRVKSICFGFGGSVVSSSDSCVTVSVPYEHALRLEQILHKTFIE